MKSLPLHNPEFIVLHRDFLTAMLAQGFSRGADNTYVRSAQEFLFFLQAKQVPNIKAMGKKDIIAFYEYLKARPNMNREDGLLCRSYVRTQMCGIRHFLDYLRLAGKIDVSPYHLPKFSYGEKGQRYVLTQAEIKILYTAVQSKRDRAILACAYGLALRRRELQNLNVSDFILSRGVVNIRESKGSKSRTLPIPQGLIKDIKEYLVYDRPHRLLYNAEDCPAFFINDAGTRMKAQRFYVRIKEMVKLTGDKDLMSKPVTIHSLRHSIATHLLDRGASIEFVRKFLGHVYLDSTIIYAKRRKQRLRLYDMMSEHLMKKGSSGNSNNKKIKDK